MSYVECKHIDFKYSNLTIFRHADLFLEQGTVNIITGDNGSGKSTLLLLLAGLLRPKSGQIAIASHNLIETIKYPTSLGLMINTPRFIPYLSGLENLQMLASINQQINETEIKEWLTKVGLDPSDNSQVKSYSTGMRKRLGLAQALMEKPDLVLLDEPLSGIDRHSRQQLIHLISTLNQHENMTFIIVVHDDAFAAIQDTTHELVDFTLQKVE